MGAPNAIPSDYESYSVLQPPPPPASSPNSTLRDKGMMYLPEGYIPGPYDVICQRGKDCHEHVGNRRFRVCVENFVDSYVNSKTRQEKSAVISNIVKMINNNDKNKQGGFIMRDPKAQRWHHVDIKVARDKVGNALRDAIKQRQDGKSCMTDSMNKAMLNQPHNDSMMTWMKVSSSAATDFFEDSTSGMDDPIVRTVHTPLALQNAQSEQCPTQSADSLFLLPPMKELTTDHSPEFLSDYDFINHQTQPGVQHQSSIQLPLDPSFFSLTPTMEPHLASNSLHSMLANTNFTLPATILPFEALVDSMDIDEFDDFEPRPIGAMFNA